MSTTTGRFAPHAYTVLRIVAGLTFAMHGSQKLLGYPPGPSHGPLPVLMIVAGIIELVGGVLVMVGLFGRIAAFLACGEMAVAYFSSHFPHGFWPIVNHGELAVLYCMVFLYVVAHGSGIWSLDALRHRAGSKAGAAFA